MKQDQSLIYKASYHHAENEKVSPLVTHLSWMNQLLIMSGCKTDEEREFYIRLAIKRIP